MGSHAPDSTRTDRRSFLRKLAAGAAVAGLAPGELAAVSVGEQPLRPPSGAAPDEAFWELVKAQFPARRGVTMMNAANLCPAPFPVTERVAELTRDVDGDVSFQNREKFDGLHQETLEALAGYLGAGPGELVVTRNTTEGNNLVVTGLDLGPGDQVVLWDQNHPSNNQAWDVRARREGFEVVRVTTPPPPASPEDRLNAFRTALTSRTRVLAFSHLSNVSGVGLPTRELCAEARERDILTLVDGAQTFGSMELDLRGLSCDFFTGSAHKWLMGPKEVGVLYVRRERLSGLWPPVLSPGWDGEGTATERLGALGQRDDAAVAAMGTAVAFHQRIGPGRVEARVRELAAALMDGIRRAVPGTTFHTPMDPVQRLGVVVFDLPDVEGREGYERLYREHGIAGAPRSGVFSGIRLCPHVYNTLADVEAVVEAVAGLA